MLSIEDKFYNQLGGKENVDKNILNLQFLGKYEFENQDMDILYGTFEIKSIFGNKKYLFLDGGHKNRTSYLNDDFVIPTIRIDRQLNKDKSLDEKFNKAMDTIHDIGQNHIPHFINEFKKIDNIIEANNADLAIVRIKPPRILSWKSYYNDSEPSFFNFVNGSIIILYKKTGEEKEFDISKFIEFYK